MELREKINEIVLAERLERIFTKDVKVNWYDIIKVLEENGLEIRNIIEK